jgi:hypothetical protein
VAFKRRAIPFGRRPCLLPSLCITSFHLPSPRMGEARRLFALSLEERNSVGVGTFQPSFGFKDFHHPRWGGGRAEPALYLPRGFVGHPLPRCSKERALTGPAGDTDFDNAGLGDGGRRHLQRVGCVGLAPSGPFCRGAAAAPCAREDRPRCRALLGRRSCSGVVLPLHRDGAFTRRPVPHSSGRI